MEYARICMKYAGICTEVACIWRTITFCLTYIIQCCLIVPYSSTPNIIFLSITNAFHFYSQIWHLVTEVRLTAAAAVLAAAGQQLKEKVSPSGYALDSLSSALIFPSQSWVMRSQRG